MEVWADFRHENGDTLRPTTAVMEEMEEMPVDVVEAALARGAELDLKETAAELLEELRALGWDKER